MRFPTHFQTAKNRAVCIPLLLQRISLTLLLFCFSTNVGFAITYWWRAVPADNVWTNPANWSTVGFFSGTNAGTFPGPADVATFGLLAETTAPITFTGIPLAGVGAINAATLQRVITIPAGETLTITGTGSDAGGNANITIAAGATMRILAGATVQGAGGGNRWNISGTVEIVDDGAVISSGMVFYPGSTLRYIGTGTKTVGFELINGNTNLPYAGGFPGNIIVNRAVGSNLIFPNNAVITGTTTLQQGTVNDGGTYSITFNGNFNMSGASFANTRLILWGGATATFAGATNTITGGELWNAGTVTVNQPLTISGGQLAMMGTGAGVGGPGTVNGSSNIIYTAGGRISFNAGWNASTTPQMFPAFPTQMNGLVDFGGGNNVTIGSDVFLAGDINSGGGTTTTIPMPRRVILGNGTLTLMSLLTVQIGSIIELRRPTLQAAWFVGQQIGGLEINNAGNVTLTNSLTVRNTIAMTNAGNLVVGANTLTINSPASPFFTGAGAGKVDATNAASVILLQSNPNIDCGYFTGTISTLRSGTGCAAYLLNALTVGNLDHQLGTIILGSGPPACTMTLAGGGTHTIAAGADLTIASFGRLILPGATTLTNNGTITVGSAGIFEVQNDGVLMNISPSYSPTGARGTLLYTGATYRNAGAEWTTTMDGNVTVDKGAVNQMGLTAPPTRTQNGTLTIQTGMLRVTGSGNLALSAVVPAHNVQNNAILRVGDGSTITGLTNLTVAMGGTFSVLYNGGALPTRAGTPNYLMGGILSYNGTNGLTTESEFPNMMPGSVDIANAGVIVQQAGTTKTVAGTFALVGGATYSLNGSTGNGLVLNGPLANGGLGRFQAFNNDFTINNTVTGDLRFGPSAAEWTLNNFTLGGGASNFTLGQPLEINGTLTLSGGNIITSLGNSLTVNNTAPAAVVRTNGFVQGPLNRAVTAAGAYLFPTGAGGTYMPITLTNPGAAATVRMTADNTGFTSPGPHSSLSSVFGANGSWRMDVAAGTVGGGATTVMVRPLTAPTPTTAVGFTTGMRTNPYTSIGSAVAAPDVSSVAGAVLTASPATRFFAVGEGALPPTNLVFSNITNTSFDASFTAAVPAPTGYLVVRRPSAAASTAPVNGTMYAVGAMLGMGSVISNNASVGPIVSAGLTAGTEYVVEVYSYTGAVATPNYVTGQLLTGTVTTIGGAGCATLSPPATVNVNLYERSINFTGVALTGAGVLAGAGTNTVFVSAGGAVTLAYNYAGVGGVPTYCPGCITQIYVGLNSAPAANVFRDCLNGFAYNATGSRTGINFTAPAAPGVYYINVTGTWDYSCQPVNFGTSYAANNTIGIVIVGTPPCVNTSDIVPAAFTPNLTIPYVINTGATVTAAMPNVWRFTLRDGGTTMPPMTDADNLPTVLAGVTVSITNPGNLDRLALFDATGTVKLDEQATGATVSFTIPAGLRPANATAADNASVDFVLKASYRSVVTENIPFSFSITNAVSEPFAPGAPRSTILNPAALVGPSGNSGIVVVADRFKVAQQPVLSIVTGATMRLSPSVYAVDVNGSFNGDYAGAVTAANPKLSPASPLNTTATAGVAMFPTVRLLGGTSATETLTFDDMGPFPAIVSNTFNLIHPSIIYAPAAAISLGNVPIGTVLDTVITIFASNVIAPGTLYFARPVTGLTFGFPMMSTQVTPLTLTPTVTPSDMGGVTYTQQIRIRYQPLMAANDTAIVQTNFGQATVPLTIVARAVNPNPFTLSFTRRELIYDSTGVSSRAVLSGSSIATVVVSAFRQDSLWATIQGTRTITLTPVPLPGSTATFTINNQPSISLPITNTTSATFSNVEVRWTNAPLTASSTQLFLRAVISDPSVLATNISITLSVGNTQPVVTSFTPRYAAPGQPVTINGANFFSIQNVWFNGHPATNIQTVSATQLIATVPAGIIADTGRVRVSNGFFADSLSRFEVARPPQLREYFAVENGMRRGYEENVQAENKAVRFIGRNFGPRYNTAEAVSPPNVRFGGVDASFAFVLNDSIASATVGAGQSGTVEYQNLAGTTTASASFVFLSRPIISGVSPLFAGLNQEITVTGANFRVIDTLKLGNIVLPNTRYTVDNNFSRIRFRLLDTVSNAPIYLATAAGSTTSTQRFTFVPPPEILSVSPDSGTFGTALTLTGRNFIQVTTVTVGGRPPLFVTPISQTQLIVVAGQGETGQAPITLATPGGSTSSTFRFTFINIPRVLGFSPVRGGPGTEVIITGANFTNIQQVTFGELPAKSFVVRSTTEIVAVVGDNGATGQVKVLNSAGQGLGRNLFNFYFPPRPGSFEPFQGATGTTITITGNDFIEVSTVTVGGMAVADFRVVDDKTIIAIVSTGATGQVAVSNIGGVGRTSGVFRFVEPERPGAPFITTFSPDTAYVGDALRLDGFNFINVRNIKISGVTVSTYSVDSPTQITLIVPRTSTGTIEVTTTTGTGTAKKIFVYAPPARPLTPREQDSIIAVQVYNTTDGQNWARQLGWLTTIPLNDWQGVVVENGRITRLVLDSAGLRGEIPAFVSRLTALKLISLRANALTGAFPQGLTALPELEELNLSNNQYSGALPTGIGAMRRLKVLRLDGNRFTGQLPSDLCDLAAIEELNFARNSFTGRIPACLSKLTTLQRLDLGRNQLTGGIPTEFTDFTNLRELLLGGNLLETPLPTTIWGNTTGTAVATTVAQSPSGKNGNASIHAGGMAALTKLDLSNNRFAGTIPAEMARASRLETVLLNGNRFTGGIPATFGDLKSLRELDASNNFLSGQIPVQIADARALERLALTKNEFTGSIPAVLGGLPNLRALALDSNTFTGAVPDALQQLARLQSLRLQKNNLAAIPNLRGLTALTVLNVAQNQLLFETIEQNVRSGDVAFTYTFAPQDTVRMLRDTAAAVGFRFSLGLQMTSENNVYQWFKNGRAVPNSNNVALTFAQFARLDTGVYQCAITNTAARGLTLLTRPVRVSAAPAVIPNAAPILVSPANNIGNVELTTLFQWEAVPSAGAYDIQIATDQAFTMLVADETTNTTQFRPLSGVLKNFVTYRWRVRARNEAGTGAWSEVRTFTTIQEGAVLVVPDADLGRSIVGRQRVGTISVQNILTMPVSIDGARIAGRDINSFGIRTALAGKVIMPGEFLQIELVFTPQSPGAKQAELLLSVSAGGATKEQRGFLRGTASLLDVNDVKFDTVLAGFAKLRNVALLNLDSKATVIKSVSVADPMIFQIDVPTPPPYTVGRGDTLILPIRCFTQRLGKALSAITIVTDAGDSLTISAEAIVREVRESDIRATFALRALDSNVAPGGRVRLEFYIKSNNGNDVLKADNPSFRAELRFNKNVLVPAPEEQRLRAVGGDELQRYSIAQTQWEPNPATINQISMFTCIAVSGNTDVTPLLVSSVQWGTDKVFISTSTATFTSNACKAGGLRLTTTAKASKIALVRPNPAKDVAEIVYGVREDGNIELALFDAQGKHVTTLVAGDHAPGEYSITLQTSTLPSGAYFLVMQTPSGKVQERLQVVK